MPISVENAPIQLSLDSNSLLNSQRTSRSQSRSSSTSSSELASDDDDNGDSNEHSPSCDTDRDPRLARSISSLGSSWGISGVGMGFNSTWGTAEPDSEHSGEEYDDEEDDETEDGNTSGVAREAQQRLELNTHLNSRTSFTGFGGMEMVSPMPLSDTPGGMPPSVALHAMNVNGVGPNYPDRQNLGPRLSVSNLLGPRLIPTRGVISRTVESPTRLSGAITSPLHEYPVPHAQVISQLREPSGEKAALIDEPSSTHPIFPPAPRSPKQKPESRRSFTLPSPSSHRGSSAIRTTDHPHTPSSPTSSPLRPAFTPPRPSVPVRSASSASFGSLTTPRVRSRRRNASSNRISLVAGRQVPLPFDPTADFDPLPPLVPRIFTPENPIVSGQLESLPTEVGASERQSLFSTGADQIRHNAQRSSMPVIPPLFRHPQAPPSRIPSATSVPAPFRLVEPNDSNILSPSGIVTFAASPVSATPSESDVVREEATSLSRSPSRRSPGHRHKKSRSKEKESTVISGGRSVNDFVITGEAGRGAYGLVKRVREKLPDGSLGPPLILKQVIKSRILADCWKKHVVYGTIPIEIHIMAAISSNEYILPPSRPWDPLRFDYWARGRSCSDAIAPFPPNPGAAAAEKHSSNVEPLSLSSRRSSMNASPAAVDRKTSIASLSLVESPRSPSPAVSSEKYKLDPKFAGFEGGWQWREGSIHRGHPSVIPLLEFFEDAHFYYLLLPAATPSFPPSPHFPPINLPTSHPSNRTNGVAEKKFPSDLFDLVERFPYGLPPVLIRTYLGQIADGLAFLHARGICHRDIKDENIVLAEDGRCWLIDFGSSGVVKKEGWDTFSGTLDYAGPEILRGEVYMGPPQDVWAFGIVSYVLVVGECPFSSASEAAAGLAQGSKALAALEGRCGRSRPSTPSLVNVTPPVLFPPPTPTTQSSSPEPTSSPPELSWNDTWLDFTDFAPIYDTEQERLKMGEGMERDGGGKLGDAMALIKACLQLDISRRPSFDELLSCRYLSGGNGWADVNDIIRNVDGVKSVGS